MTTSPDETSPSVCDERQEVYSSQFVAIERAPSSFDDHSQDGDFKNNSRDAAADGASRQTVSVHQKEESKQSKRIGKFKIEPAQVEGLSDNSGTILAEFDAPDDDEIDLETHFSAAQRQIIQNKTQLEVKDKKLNNEKFRRAYMRAKVPTRELLERKV